MLGEGCDHPAMAIRSHDGKLYEITSGYSLPDDAWQYELVGLTGPPGTGPYLSVLIPDATPDGPFTPRPAEHVMVVPAAASCPGRSWRSWCTCSTPAAIWSMSYGTCRRRRPRFQ
ncbi:hypothetical protein GCM10029963_75050 [Micromonospora andamanensis]|nr:hypothetical protein Vwe01_44990 [Micromonospora andamanensis]